MMEAEFVIEKETTNTVRYRITDDSELVARNIYVEKWALKRLNGGEIPKRIRVTIDAV